MNVPERWLMQLSALPHTPYPHTFLTHRPHPLVYLNLHTQEAESLLLRATALQPDLPKAWKALVDLYEEGEKWKEAIGATEVRREGGREGGREGEREGGRGGSVQASRQ